MEVTWYCVIRYEKGAKEKGTEHSASRTLIAEYPVAVGKPKSLILLGLLVQCTQGYPMSIKTFIDLWMGTNHNFLFKLAVNWKGRFEVFLSWWNPHLLWNSLLCKSWIAWGQVQIQANRLRICQSTTSDFSVWFDLGRMKNQPFSDFCIILSR